MTDLTTPPATPMLDKMNAVRDQSQCIGEFLEWLKNQPDYSIRERREFSEERETLTGIVRGTDETYIYTWTGWLPIRKSIDKLLAEYFDVDLNQMEQEQRALLKYVRDHNNQKITS